MLYKHSLIHILYKYNKYKVLWINQLHLILIYYNHNNKYNNYNLKKLHKINKYNYYNILIKLILINYQYIF